MQQFVIECDFCGSKVMVGDKATLQCPNCAGSLDMDKARSLGGDYQEYLQPMRDFVHAPSSSASVYYPYNGPYYGYSSSRY